MKGGINKFLRNIVANQAGTEFEKVSQPRMLSRLVDWRCSE